MNIHEVSHAPGEIGSGSAVGDLDLTPGTMGIDEDEQVGRAVATVFVLRLARFSRDRLARLTDQSSGIFVAANDGMLRIGYLRIEIEHIAHPRYTGALTPGIHHMSRRQGLRSFSAKQRRTVSRERASWSV